MKSFGRFRKGKKAFKQANNLGQYWVFTDGMSSRWRTLVWRYNDFHNRRLDAMIAEVKAAQKTAQVAALAMGCMCQAMAIRQDLRLTPAEKAMRTAMLVIDQAKAIGKIFNPDVPFLSYDMGDPAGDHTAMMIIDEWSVPLFDIKPAHIPAGVPVIPFDFVSDPPLKWDPTTEQMRKLDKILDEQAIKTPRKFNFT